MKKFLFSVLLIGTCAFFITGCSKEKTIVDKSQFTDYEVIEYLESRGFEFEINEFTSVYTTRYVYVSNDSNSILIQKITDRIIGKSYLWKNDDINDEWAYIKNEYQNESMEEQKQYKEFEKWLEYEGLTSKQIIDALDYYDATND